MLHDNKKKYIILTGSDGGYGNLGDEFILDAVKSFYRKFLCEYRIIILKANIDKEKQDGFIYVSDNEASFNAMNIDLSSIVLVHYYGGGYLNDHWFEEKIWFYKMISKNGFSKDGIIFSGQGLGPFSNEKREDMLKIINDASIFGVRDLLLLNNFNAKQFSFDDSIFLFDKIKFIANLIHSLIVRKIFRKKMRVAINLRIADFVGVERVKYLDFLRTVFEKNSEYSICFFSMLENQHVTEEGDIRSMLLEFGIKDIKFHQRPKNYKELVKIVRKNDLVITTSYHAVLASLYSLVPSIAIYESEYYKEKFSGIENLFGDRAIFKVTNINKFGFEMLHEALHFSLGKYFNTVIELFKLKTCNILFVNKIRCMLKADANK